MSLVSCIGGHRASKSSRRRKSWVITHENGQKWPKSRVLPMLLESCTGDHGASKSSWGRKSWVITHENGLKCSKSRVLPMLLESCTEGQKASKISWDPKLVSYNPRKRPEMAEITSFVDASRVMYQRVIGHRNPPRAENRGL